MIVPLAMTIYFSTLHYNLLNPGRSSSSASRTTPIS